MVPPLIAENFERIFSKLILVKCLKSINFENQFLLQQFKDQNSSFLLLSYNIEVQIKLVKTLFNWPNLLALYE